MFFIKVIFSFTLSLVLVVIIFKINQELKTQKNKKDKTYKKLSLAISVLSAVALLFFINGMTSIYFHFKI